jgi:hypothetical protein
MEHLPTTNMRQVNISCRTVPVAGSAEGQPLTADSHVAHRTGTSRRPTVDAGCDPPNERMVNFDRLLSAFFARIKSTVDSTAPHLRTGSQCGVSEQHWGAGLGSSNPAPPIR